MNTHPALLKSRQRLEEEIKLSRELYGDRFADGLKECLDMLNVERPDIAALPDGGVICRTIVNDRVLDVLLRDLLVYISSSAADVQGLVDKLDALAYFPATKDSESIWNDAVDACMELGKAHLKDSPARNEGEPNDAGDFLANKMLKNADKFMKSQPIDDVQEYKLPFDVKIGPIRFGKGVKLQTLIDAATRWHKAASDAAMVGINVEEARAALSVILANPNEMSEAHLSAQPAGEYQAAMKSNQGE